MKEIVIQEELQIGDKILEKGDKIRILKESLTLPKIGDIFDVSRIKSLIKDEKLIDNMIMNQYGFIPLEIKMVDLNSGEVGLSQVSITTWPSFGVENGLIVLESAFGFGEEDKVFCKKAKVAQY